MEDERQRLIRIEANLQRRALINDLTRAFFRERGFLDIETPVRVPTIAPELHITPFETEDWFLSTSPELHMKRLLAAGYERLFQISRCFRKGERGRHHNPEFTMLEWYRTGADYLQMVHDTEELVMTLVTRLQLGPKISYRGRMIDLSLPWPITSVADAFRRTAGWDPVVQSDPLRFDTDLMTRVIPNSEPGRPVVLVDYPAAMASLARLKPGNIAVAERAEVFIAGLELANAFSELTDAAEQKQRFAEEIERIHLERGRKIAMPTQFIDAMSRLSECGGIALGMDRLAMLLCDADSIDEVMAFTAGTV